MSQLYDRFFAFFNGMVGGNVFSKQDGLRSSWCSLSKSSKSDYRHNPRLPLSTLGLSTASPKSSKVKGHLHSSKVSSFPLRITDPSSRSRHHGIRTIWDLWEFQEISCHKKWNTIKSWAIEHARQSHRSFRYRNSIIILSRKS